MNDNRLEIYEKFSSYVRAWESGMVELLDAVLEKKTFIQTSILGSFYSRDAFKGRLKESRNNLEFSEFEITNYVCRIDGDIAQQYAAISGKTSDGIREDYQFCGAFVNKFVRMENGWRISESSFDLLDDNTVYCRFDDNGTFRKTKKKTEFAAPNWHLIWDDVAVYDGCRLPVILGELQAPWYVIACNEQMADEDAVKELFYRFAFAVDMSSLSLLVDILADNVSFKSIVLGECEKENGLQAIKGIKRTIGQRGQHLAYFTKLNVDEDEAEAVIQCKSPGIINGIYVMKAVKENEEWRIVGLEFTV